MKLNANRVLPLMALIAFGAVGAALVSQHVFGVMPCAWCVFQRLIFLAIGLVCLPGMAGGARLARPAAALAGLLALGGITAAWYQVNVAAKMLSCNQTFADRVMNATGLDAALPWLFGIYATCADAAARFLGLDYAIWSLLLHALIALIALMALAAPRPRRV
jgi:disulfide bond formation protein DsbB